MKVPFNLISDANYKYIRFNKTFLKKNFQFVLYEKNARVMLDPSLILFPAKSDLILKEQSCKNDAFVVFSPSGIEIVVALLAKIKVLYVQVSKI